MKCPLCDSNQANAFFRDKERAFLQCKNCSLVFVPGKDRLSAIEEKSRYDLHQNSPDDPEYRKFLSRLFGPLCDKIAPPASGLDYGSGPGPTLSIMFEEAGYKMALYDIFYSNNASVLKSKYDFITCTEVVEHLHNPGKVLMELYGLLKPGGLLGIMTKMVIDLKAFSKWHYKNDPTHVCFFSRDTFSHLTGTLKCHVTFIGKDVILLQKR